MPSRINRAIELLALDQAIYYVGAHTGHVLTAAQGREDAGTWADYINVGMEHGAFDMTGLEAYMRGLVEGGPTRSGHRAPTVIVEAPVNGIDETHVRYNAWQFRQILGRGAAAFCCARPRPAPRAFVRACRYPHHRDGVDPSLPTPLQRMQGDLSRPPRSGLGAGTRARLGGDRGGGLGVGLPEYMERCEPWPLNPNGELLLGVKLESPEGIARCEDILATPGLGFAELGPGDLSLALGYKEMPRDSYPPEMQEARERVLAACKQRWPRLSRNRHPRQHHREDRPGGAGVCRP